MDWLLYVVYGIPAALLFAWHLRKRRRIEARSAATQRETGQAEPASLHPIIDPGRCIGCGSCLKACPEQEHHVVLGLVGGQASLVNPGDCIGHGACKLVCPVDAITLVFGSERRGVDIPLLTPHFESTVPGVFVAGELGGMGLIRNALEQGRQAVEAIIARRPRGSGDLLDLVIVGAGPAGFSASLTALSHKLRYVTLEQESLGGSVFQYPRGKLVMTAPANVPLLGKVNFRQTSKEALLEFWKQAESRTGVRINYQERVDEIEKSGEGFVVHTSRGRYQTRSVLLAIGRRGSPRKLGVPGENLPKVVYRLIDPEQYSGRRVLVVGGGDSALEAAASIADCGGEVLLSYRGESFDRAKSRNRERVESGARSGRLRLLMKSQVRSIARDLVQIEHAQSLEDVANDSVIISAGGVLPSEFLKRVGIQVDTKYGTA